MRARRNPGRLLRHALTNDEEQALKGLLGRITHLNFTQPIEELTIQFRRKHRVKLPDAIIAATAEVNGLELLTLDKKLQAKLCCSGLFHVSYRFKGICHALLNIQLTIYLNLVKWYSFLALLRGYCRTIARLNHTL